jgi:transposase
MYTLTEEQRWYIIIEWKKGSINVSQVARSFNCSRNTVYHVIDYYRRHNDVNYTDRYNADRPRALDSTQTEQLDRTIRQNRSATGAELLSLTNFNTSERTIRRYRLSLGYRPRKSVVKIKSNNFNEQKRYTFAAVHHRANIKKYIFEDESYVGLRNTQQIVWCKRGEPTPKKEISSLRAHVNLIGFIWWNGYVFRRFNGWLNSDTYCETVNEILSGNLRELNGFLYISDRIRWHRSAQFQQWCDEYNIELCEWPGYSPDFNAIELVWNIIKQKVKSKNPKSQNELENAIDEALYSLSINVIQSCIKKTQKIYQQFVSSY